MLHQITAVTVYSVIKVLEFCRGFADVKISDKLPHLNRGWLTKELSHYCIVADCIQENGVSENIWENQ